MPNTSQKVHRVYASSFRLRAQKNYSRFLILTVEDTIYLINSSFNGIIDVLKHITEIDLSVLQIRPPTVLHIYEVLGKPQKGLF